ncbi:hypothetical protein MHO82_25545 [Vibrio sp. Of7-15]|uniref:hypothetical protein n=1 Tax=Vibrio sp. Of7-15 TaxID=2724879 RepID=UPI001EF35ADE|nr:hypothetical protein [Vibrio sp. Of7-15]MCG7500216.1 hypothetical protein [Vibrio sp. Of7-15]
MSLKQQTKEQYEAILQSVMNDPELKDDKARLQQFSNTYKDIVLAEPAIMEWEFDHWEKQTVSEFNSAITFIIFAAIFSVYAMSENWYMFTGPLAGIIIFINSMLMYPIRFKHKLTESGVYVYRYKRGKKIRQFLAGFLLLITVIAGIVLTFYMGLMAFAGAGAGMLGIFTFYALIQKQDKVKEAAIPWQGMFLVSDYSKNSFLRKDRNFFIHYMDVRCSVNDYERVKGVIKSKMREDVLYTEEENDDYCSDEFHEAIKRRELELPFYDGRLFDR